MADKRFFTELKKELNNIIITVKDNCLYTNKHTHTHTRTHISMSRKNNRQDKGKGIFISNLIKRSKRERERKKMRERMSRCFLDRRREWFFFLLEFLIEQSFFISIMIEKSCSHICTCTPCLNTFSY